MRKIMTTLLVVLLGGFHGLAPWVFAASTDTFAPILRHLPPDPVQPGETMVIEAVVENKNKISTVTLWVREVGEKRFHKTLMTLTKHKTYEGHIEVAGAFFKKGIEYYIEAIDLLGNTGWDGNQEKPYFVEIRAASSVTSLTFGLVQDKKRETKPFWKKTWFWIAVVAAVGGGVAAARSAGGDGGNSGTVVVE